MKIPYGASTTQVHLQQQKLLLLLKLFDYMNLLDFLVPFFCSILFDILFPSLACMQKRSLLCELHHSLLAPAAASANRVSYSSLRTTPIRNYRYISLFFFY